MSEPRRGGRPLEADGQAARTLGITKRQVKRLGGSARLSRMKPDALAILLNLSHALKSMAPSSDFLIEPHVAMPQNIEELLSEQDIDAIGVEGAE